MKFKLSSAVGALAGLLSAVSLLRLNPNKMKIVGWKEVIEWFTKMSTIKSSDQDNIAFTLLRRPQVRPENAALPSISIEEQSKASVILVQGIFNKRTESIVEARVVEATQLDDELAEAHKNNELVIYE